MSFGVRFWRVGAAGVVLAGLAGISARLGPLYVGNYRFQRFLEQFTREADNRYRPDELLRVAIVNKAAEFGLPVRRDQVRLNRTPERLAVEVRYVVPVNLPLYTVDLHFRPRAP